MATSVPARALRHARDSWVGQLGVLLLGVLLLGSASSLLDVLGMDLQAFVAIAVTTLLVAGAVRAADIQEDEISAGGLAAEVLELAGLAPRLFAQVGLSSAPLLVTGFLTLQIAGAVPVVGLALMPLSFALAIATVPVALLSIVGVARGDQHWWPMYGWQALRARPSDLLVAALVGAVVIMMAAVPIMLMGFVVTAIAGPLGMLGMGLASASVIPLAGCWALALWEHVGHDDAVSRAVAVPAPAELGTPASIETPWVDGPSWNVAIEPGAVWGTWVGVASATDVAFRLSWSGTVPPQVALATEDGTWRTPGNASRPGDSIPASLPAGNTYVQVGCADVAAQSISITMLVRARAVA